MLMPASAAARSTEVPLGTETSRPSMLRLTCCSVAYSTLYSGTGAGVP